MFDKFFFLCLLKVLFLSDKVKDFGCFREFVFERYDFFAFFWGVKGDCGVVLEKKGSFFRRGVEGYFRICFVEGEFFCCEIVNYFV